MTDPAKRTIPATLIIFLVGGALTFTAQWATTRKAVADHVAEAAIHQPNDVLAEQVEGLKEELDEFKDETRDEWANQGQVNTEMLKGLGKIQGHLGIN